MKQNSIIQSAGGTAGQNHEYLPDRAVSHADDPDLGAAALEDNAKGGGGDVGGSRAGGGFEDWLDGDDEEAAPRR